MFVCCVGYGQPPGRRSGGARKLKKLPKNSSSRPRSTSSPNVVTDFADSTRVSVEEEDGTPGTAVESPFLQPSWHGNFRKLFRPAVYYQILFRIQRPAYVLLLVSPFFQRHCCRLRNPSWQGHLTLRSVSIGPSYRMAACRSCSSRFSLRRSSPAPRRRIPGRPSMKKFLRCLVRTKSCLLNQVRLWLFLRV